MFSLRYELSEVVGGGGGIFQDLFNISKDYVLTHCVVQDQGCQKNCECLYEDNWHINDKLSHNQIVYDVLHLVDGGTNCSTGLQRDGHMRS